jgi:hypothetical protein
MNNLTQKFYSLVLLACFFTVCPPLRADNENKPSLKRVEADTDNQETRSPQLISIPTLTQRKPDTISNKTESSPVRKLASGNISDDLDHYYKMDKRLGVDIGVMNPFGDFQKEFTAGTMIGLHFAWESIAPFALIVDTQRASAFQRNGASSGKLTVSSINVGGQASFPLHRFVPFLRFESSLNFNDVSFDANRIVTSGSDTFITTLGFNFGLGVDCIVGRELSFGFEAVYHYQIPKKVNLSNGTMFDLGSSYANLGFRVNF